MKAIFRSQSVEDKPVKHSKPVMLARQKSVSSANPASIRRMTSVSSSRVNPLSAVRSARKPIKPSWDIFSPCGGTADGSFIPVEELPDATLIVSQLSGHVKRLRHKVVSTRLLIIYLFHYLV